MISIITFIDIHKAETTFSDLKKSVPQDLKTKHNRLENADSSAARKAATSKPNHWLTAASVHF